MMLREPCVAGRFYPADPERLQAELGRCLSRDAEPSQEAAIAIVVPHAGYVYSGAIAGRTYARARVPRRVVVLCPNHTGQGGRRSIWPEGAWRVPTGDVEVDEPFARRLIELGFEADFLAHMAEHAIEVQLPFVRSRNSDAQIVPICLGGELEYASCQALGIALADAVRADGTPTLIVASTDMSHYISAEAARKLDGLALRCIASIEAEALYTTVRRHGISMCGYVPTTVALVAARALGARRAELVEYGNSGAVSGDLEHVVGYAGVLVC